MVTASGLRLDVAGMLALGEKIRFRYFSVSGGSAAYDDDVVLTVSGSDFWTSGLAQPLDTRRGSFEAVLVEQGKLLENDLRVFLDGTVNTSGLWKLGIGGSPPASEYALIGDGVNAWQVNGQVVYKKAYIRRLTVGSILGE